MEKIVPKRQTSVYVSVSTVMFILQKKEDKRGIPGRDGNHLLTVRRYLLLDPKMISHGISQHDRLCGVVLHLVEHRAVMREVVSSTPAGPTLRVLK